MQHSTPPAPLTAPAPTIADRQAAGDRSWSSDHAVNLRLSIPLGFGRYYLTVVAGKERRGRERRVHERRKHPLRTVGNVLFLLIVGGIQLLGGLYVMQRLLIAAFSQG